MKNINIKYKVAAIILAIGATYSCSKEELELLPISATSDAQFYKTDADLFAATLAIYDGLQAIPTNEHALLEMRSDNAKTNLHEGEWKQLETFEVQPTNSVVAGYWSANYNVIFRANKVLQNADVILNATKKANYTGEAKFARALAHFNLVRAFGEVPVISKIVAIDDNASFAKNTVAQAYTLIEQDLTDAIATLPSKTASSFGRATKEAAQGLLAKVYLTRHNYTAAQPLLDVLVALPSTTHTLQSVYKNVFYTEGNSEILFAIPYTYNSSTEGQTFSYEMTVGQASGLTFVSADFASFMSDANDARKAVNINPLITGHNGKYLTPTVGIRNAGNDWIVLRFADILLMYVEAKIGSGTSTTDANAITYYDRVRNRSFTTAVTSTSITKAQLLDQRRAEFAFENQRLYDLIRFGEANTVLTAYDTNNTYTDISFENPKDLLLPIPQTEINVSGGALKQNPNY